MTELRLIARGLEAEGIPAVLVSVMPPLSSASRPTLQVIRRPNTGATVKRLHDVEGQRETDEFDQPAGNR